MAEKERKQKVRTYWLDGLFFDQGKCWATNMIAAGDGRYEAEPLFLGEEPVIVPILKGDMVIPEDLHPQQRRILTEILGRREYERVSKPTTRAASLQRARLIRSPRHIARDVRHA